MGRGADVVAVLGKADLLESMASAVVAIVSLAADEALVSVLVSVLDPEQAVSRNRTAGRNRSATVRKNIRYYGV